VKEVEELKLARRLDSAKFGTHSSRRTKGGSDLPTFVNLWAAQLCSGIVESTVCYLGIGVNEVIEIADKIDA